MLQRKRPFLDILKHLNVSSGGLVTEADELKEWLCSHCYSTNLWSSIKEHISWRRMEANADEWNVMSKRDTGAAHSCLGLGCGFAAYTSLPSKYEKHYHINNSLGLGMALPQNPKILYSLVTMAENVHAFILGQVISFRVITIPAMMMHWG